MVTGSDPGWVWRRGWRRAVACCCVAVPLSLLLALAFTERDRLELFLPSCTPQSKVGFLKTHKCASSTVQNILFRYGESHDLNFVLPLRGNYLGRSQPFHHRMIADVPWAGLEYDIFAMHTVWHTARVRGVLGGAPVLISIVRDPVDLFESLYSFAQWDRLFRMDINRFARAVLINSTRSSDYLSVGGYTGHNQMLHDFGLPENSSSSVRLVRAKISQIERDFDLILVAEHMEESLVLLRHLLCWRLSDVTSVPLNAREARYRRALEPESRALLRQWLWADQMLYEHFLGVFKQRREQFGERQLAREADELRALNLELQRLCRVEEASFSTLRGDLRPSSARVKGYRVAQGAQCERLARNELAYIDILRLRQLRGKVLNSTLGAQTLIL